MRRREFLECMAASSLVGGGGLAPSMPQSGGRAEDKTAIAVGTSRQLFLDDSWFEHSDRIQLTRHSPVLREAAISLERPWEKKWLSYSTVIQEGDRYRMWYRVTEVQESKSWTCYAESRDGAHWEKPSLGIVSREGSPDNNVVFDPSYGINATVLKDPNGSAEERYKLIVRRGGNIEGLVSADGLRWRPVSHNPLLDASLGHYDSHNVLLWDDERGVYVIYLRGFLDDSGKVRLAPDWNEVDRTGTRTWRVIRRSESPDFRRWSKPEVVVRRDGEDPETLNFYTNAAVKYPWAARAYFMFPMVLYVTNRGKKETGRQFPGTPNPGLSDIQFLSSRDGIHWHRRFRHPLIRPGLEPDNWVDRNPIMGVGMIQTGPAEISMYYSELFHSRRNCLRRCTFRTDGFVSVEAPYAGWGEFTTRPLRFDGSRLDLNYSTSGGGTILVELLDEGRKPIPGHTMADCEPIFGDKVAGGVRWSQGGDLRRLAKVPVRLRVRMRDAHLFSFRFA
jgi:hypothetical protein